MVAKQWETAKKTFLGLQRRNIGSYNSIIKRGLEVNEAIRAQISSTASKVIEQREYASEKHVLAHAEYLEQLDHNACVKTNSFVDTCFEFMKEMKSMHSRRIMEITENARKSLIDHFKVDEPSSSIPRKKRFNLPSKESIENLRSPLLDELLKPSIGVGLSKQVNEDVNGKSAAPEIAHYDTIHYGKDKLEN